MIDPQLIINTAFFSALSTPAINIDGTEFKVYIHVPGDVQQYILLSQPTSVQGNASRDCREWYCTLLLTIVTRFEAAGDVSEVLAYKVSDELFTRLVDKRLELTGFSMSPIEISLANNIHEYDQNAVNVLRYLRVKFSVYV